jgi:hypothetical protein
MLTGGGITQPLAQIEQWNAAFSQVYDAICGPHAVALTTLQTG